MLIVDTGIVRDDAVYPPARAAVRALSVRGAAVPGRARTPGRRRCPREVTPHAHRTARARAPGRARRGGF